MKATLSSFTLKQDSKSSPIEVPVRFVSNIEIYQSIYTTNPMVTITFNDVLGFRELHQLRGGFEANIKCGDVWGNMLDLDLWVANFKELGVGDQLQNNYITATCYPKEHFNLTHERLYRSYNDYKPSKIVQELLGEVNVTPSDLVETITSPGWAIGKFIRSLVPKTTSPLGGQYLFYQTLYGVYFKTTMDIIRNTPKSDILEYNNLLPDDRRHIIDLVESKTYQMLVELNEGNIKRATTYFDFNQNKFINADVDVDEITKVESDGIYLSGMTKVATKKVDLGASIAVESSSHHDVASKQFKKKMELLINGDLKLVPGMLIRVEVQARTEKIASSGEHSGLYLISKVAQHIKGSDFKSKLELIRDSVYSSQNT